MRSFLGLTTTAALLLATAQQALAVTGAEVFKRASIIEKRTPGSGAFKNPVLAKRADRFLNDRTKSFSVNGSAIPDVDFDVGESYAGLLPISQAYGETRELFFWFFPSTLHDCKEEITVWFNGGPGCSSLSGLLTENGPFTWDAGTLQPVQNAYTWVNLTNVVWVEQPVGVGFTQGTANITNEYELGDQFAGFWRSFVDLFDMKNWDVYLTGESYAGYYVPYIANAFIDQDDTEYYNLKGIAINDPIIGDGTIQQQAVIVPYVDYWQNLFFLNSSFTDAIHQKQKDCGYEDYINEYFTFPPPAGPFPVLPDPYASDNLTCDLFDDVFNAVLLVNPCFNIYHISDQCPHPWSVLGIVNTGDYIPPDEVVYFNRSDVQKAINAPVGTNWMQCTDNNVFAGDGSDMSVGPAQDGVLQRVIEYTNNTIIGSGNLDMLLSTNGTLFAIQNMTWNGAQGFQSFPGEPLYTPYHPEYNGGSLAGAGLLGSWGSERGLTFYQVQLSGHELPGYAPGAAYRALEILLGRVKDFSQDTVDFSTQTGNYTGTTPIYKGKFRVNDIFNHGNGM